MVTTGIRVTRAQGTPHDAVFNDDTIHDVDRKGQGARIPELVDGSRVPGHGVVRRTRPVTKRSTVPVQPHRTTKLR